MLTKLLLLCCFTTTFGQTTTPAPVPTVDQCASVNATLPPQCPDTIGPPCPPCYTNTRPDYTDGASIKLTDDDRQNILDNMNYWINYWLENYPPSKNYPPGDYNTFVGLAGRGQIFLRLYRYTKNETYLSIAEEYISHALNILPREDQYPSYFFGFTGVWTLAAILNDIQGNNDNVTTYQNNILNVFINVDDAINNGGSTNYAMNIGGIDEGFAGLVYAGMLVNTYFNDDIIPPAYIRNVSLYMMDIGIKNGEKNGNNYLQYECPFIEDCYMWGMGHGSGGVIKMLYQAYDMGYLPDIFDINGYYYPYIEATMNNFVDVQLVDGNMPTAVNGTCASDYGDDPDARVQWCHGAPGFIDVFLAGAWYWGKLGLNSTERESYLNSGLKALGAVWNRGLLVKGLMHCHGIGGNLYMLLNGYKWLSDTTQFPDYQFQAQQSAYRSNQFILWTLKSTNTDKLRCEDSNENYSMFQGCPGIVLPYIQALQTEWPDQLQPCMPGWDLCY